MKPPPNAPLLLPGHDAGPPTGLRSVSPCFTGSDQRIRILIATEYPLLRAGVWGALNCNQGYQMVGEPADGQALMRCLAETSCDVVIMDFALPYEGQPDRWELLRGVCNTHRCLGVVVLLSLAKPALIYRLVSEGVHAVLAYTAPLAELEVAIRSISHSAPYVNEALRASLHMDGDTGVPKKQVSRPLSLAETEVVRLLDSRMSIKAIAESKGKSVRTISAQRHSAMHKLGMTNDQQRWRSLSPAEVEVVRLLASGMSVKAIAQSKGRDVRTISTQKHSAMSKLGVTNDQQLWEYLRKGAW